MTREHFRSEALINKRVPTADLLKEIRNYLAPDDDFLGGAKVGRSSGGWSTSERLTGFAEGLEARGKESVTDTIQYILNFIREQAQRLEYLETRLNTELQDERNLLNALRTLASVVERHEDEFQKMKNPPEVPEEKRDRPEGRDV